MYYHKPTKTAYYANPKTASTATSNALTKQADFEQIGPHHHGPNAVKEQVPEIHQSFCTVRNHFDMIVSWHYFIQSTENNHPPITLERTKQLVEQHMDNYITEPLMWPVARKCSVVLIYDRKTLENQLNEVLRRLRISAVDLDHMKSSGHRPHNKPWTQHFTNDAENYIINKFGEEMEYYGFKE